MKNLAIIAGFIVAIVVGMFFSNYAYERRIIVISDIAKSNRIGIVPCSKPDYCYTCVHFDYDRGPTCKFTFSYYCPGQQSANIIDHIQKYYRANKPDVIRERSYTSVGERLTQCV